MNCISKRWLICGGFSALLGFATWVSSARGDILVSFPSGSDPAWVTAFTEEIEHSVEVPAVGVVALDPQDTSPRYTLPKRAREMLETARTEYKELRLDKVLKVLDGAEAVCLDEADFATCRSFLFEVNLLRGMAFEALGKDAPGAQAFRSAHLAERTRVLDPRLYPPRILRAFAKACSSSSKQGTLKLSLSSLPAGADFLLDGDAVTTPTLDLGPGRHVVEARFVGYQRAWRMLEVAADGGKPATLRFVLEAKSEMEAWKALIDRVSSPSWRPGARGMAPLLERFHIDYVVLLERPEAGSARYEASIVKSGEADFIVMPSPGLPSGPVSTSFQNALKRVLGIPVPEPAVIAPPPAAEEDLADADDALEDDNEEEDPSIRFAGEDAPRGEAPEDRPRLVKSPWLWISLGVVAAIVSGFAVTATVSD
jgi:hypothetical protein